MKQIRRNFNTVDTSETAAAKGYLFSEISVKKLLRSLTDIGKRSFFYNGDGRIFSSRNITVPQLNYMKNKFIGDGIWTRCI